MTQPMRPLQSGLRRLPPARRPPSGPGRDLPPPRGGDRENPDLTPEQQNAYQIMVAMLKDWGLESLAPVVYDFLAQGYSQEHISLLLRDTEQYKQRFAGNEIRKREGLRVLSPAEYLEVERSYRQIMRSAGVPEGFWDQHSDFANLIGHDMSPVELQRRVERAQDAVARLDDDSKTWFRQEYGLDFDQVDRGALVAYVLDPTRGEDVIRSVLRGGTIATAARARGVNINRAMAERFGLAADDSQYGMQAARFAEYASRGAFLSDLYGGLYDVEMAGADVFFEDVRAMEERRRLQARERAQFSGGGDAARTALSSAPGGF